MNMMKYGKISAAVLLGGSLFLGGLMAGYGEKLNAAEVSAASTVGATSVETVSATRAASASASASADDTSKNLRLSAEAWLVSDLWETSLPAFKDEKNIKGEVFDNAKMLSLPGVDMEAMALSRPVAGKALRQGEGALYWQEMPVKASLVAPKLDKSKGAAWRYFCLYLTSDRFVKAEYALRLASVYELYIDGKKVLTQGQAQKNDTAGAKADADKFPAPKTHKGNIEPGLHVVMIRALVNADDMAAMPLLTVSVEAPEQPANATATPTATANAATTAAPQLTLSTAPRERYDLPHYLFGERVSSPQLSFDGRYYALSHTVAKADKSGYDRSLSVGRTDNGQTTAVYEGVSNFSFAPAAPYFGYMRKEGKRTRIYVGALGETASPVYETTEELSGFTWAPDGSFMIVGVTTKPEADKTGMHSLCSPADQWPYYKDRTHLYKLDLRSRMALSAADRKAGRLNRKNATENQWLEPLTYGVLSTEIQDISADGKKLLFYTSEMEDSVRMYMRQSMYLMDLQTKETELLWRTVQFVEGAQFSPDGKKLFVVGSESMFSDPAAVNAAKEGDALYVNDYNHKPFIFDIATKKAHYIGRDFIPSIDWFAYEPAGRCVYMLAAEADAVNLYAYRTESGTEKPVFVKMPLQTYNTERIALGGDALLYTGTSASEPVRAYLSKGPLSNPLARRTETVLYDPQWTLADHKVATNRWIDLKFATPSGDSIEGTLYLPDGLSLEELQSGSKKYPCITYYYGGTTPTPKSLDMRYPKQVWASHGYAVLVVQPSGAIGYGSEFAARHINNWGKTVGGEIMAAVQQTCQRYAFIDAAKIGCIGASYGGFMTQYLVSHCDLFAAAVSHAGISSISSYWGEGYWGYIYNGVAAANSFPWNRKDIYVDQSPLFNADKVHTPLLLLHGTSDHNVPIGESYQMYKALRLLGREVAMVTVEGEDHGIVDLPKRILWEKTILAWFDRFLKGETTWWNELYGEK